MSTESQLERWEKSQEDSLEEGVVTFQRAPPPMALV